MIEMIINAIIGIIIFIGLVFYGIGLWYNLAGSEYKVVEDKSFDLAIYSIFTLWTAVALSFLTSFIM